MSRKTVLGIIGVLSLFGYGASWAYKKSGLKITSCCARLCQTARRLSTSRQDSAGAQVALRYRNAKMNRGAYWFSAILLVFWALGR